jgi:ATP-dependent helicase YprA (DUF1998 family)
LPAEECFLPADKGCEAAEERWETAEEACEAAEECCETAEESCEAAEECCETAREGCENAHKGCKNARKCFEDSHPHRMLDLISKLREDLGRLDRKAVFAMVYKRQYGSGLRYCNSL